MGVLVVIEHKACVADVGRRLFGGQLVAASSHPISDYALTDVRTGNVLARIPDYPRWTESALALFARLLERSPRIQHLAGIAKGVVNIDVLIGCAQSRPRVREYASAIFNEGVGHASLVSPIGLVLEKSVAIRVESCVQDAVAAALATVFGWTGRAPALPCALSQVRSHSSNGTRWVLLRNVPPLARHALRIALDLPSGTRAVTEVQWFEFVEELSTGAARDHVAPCVTRSAVLV